MSMYVSKHVSMYVSELFVNLPNKWSSIPCLCFEDFGMARRASDRTRTDTLAIRKFRLLQEAF